MSFWRSMAAVTIPFAYFFMVLMILAFPLVGVWFIGLQLAGFLLFAGYQIYKRGFYNCLRWLISEDK